MAKNEIRGIVTSFRRGKQVQHTYETIIEIGEGHDLAALVGAKALWTREGGLRITGRVVARHPPPGTHSDSFSSAERAASVR